jgi:hypothetical protein
MIGPTIHHQIDGRWHKQLKTTRRAKIAVNKQALAHSFEQSAKVWWVKVSKGQLARFHGFGQVVVCCCVVPSVIFSISSDRYLLSGEEAMKQRFDDTGA